MNNLNVDIIKLGSKLLADSIMSGDSPNAFTNENVFDFKEGRSSPAPTTSKEEPTNHTHKVDNNVVTASVLVEPQQKSKDDENNEDRPDFQSPILNQDRRNSNNAGDDNNKFDSTGGKNADNTKEEMNLLNGLDRLPNTRSTTMKNLDENNDDEDKCIVNCIYYTMECCKCSII